VLSGCAAWTPRLLHTHLAADLAIGAAYFAIPVILIHLIVRPREENLVPLPFGPFAAFILLFGGTHTVEGYTIYRPGPVLSAVVRASTALISWATVLVLIRGTLQLDRQGPPGDLALPGRFLMACGIWLRHRPGMVGSLAVLITAGGLALVTARGFVTGTQDRLSSRISHVTASAPIE
jgi:hypothetical protein